MYTDTSKIPTDAFSVHQHLADGIYIYLIYIYI